MTARQLACLHSWRTDDLIAHLNELEERLGENRLFSLLENGRSLDAVPGSGHAPLRIPLKAIRYDAKAEADEVDRREHLRESRRRSRKHEEKSALRDDDPSAQIYAPRHRPKPTDTPKPLDDDLVDNRIDRAVILGDPGSGKTCFLRAQVRRVAWRSREKLESGEALPEDVIVPVFLHLADVIAAIKVLSSEGNLGQFLIDLGVPYDDAKRPWAELGPRDELSADRFARALLYAVKISCGGRFAARLGRVLWSRLSPNHGLGEKSALICLDGWDEIGSGPQNLLATGLKDYADRVTGTGRKGTRILLASRVAGYGGSPLFAAPSARYAELRICAFDDADRKKFIEGYFDDRKEIALKLIAELRSNYAIGGFAANPLLATLLCAVYLNEKGEPIALPLRRGEIYELVIAKLLKDWTEVREGIDADGYEPWIDEDVKRESLIRLFEAVAVKFFRKQRMTAGALDMFLREHRAVLADPKTGDPDMYAYLSGLKKNTARWLCERHLLAGIGFGGMADRGDDNRSFIFLHLTFQEYLVARHLAREANEKGWKSIRKLIDQKSWSPRWEEVIVLLAGLLDDPGPLLDLLADKNKDDAWQSRTILAALCLPEIRKNKRKDLEAKIAEIAERVMAGALEEAAHVDGVPHHHRPGVVAAAVAGARLGNRTILESLAMRIDRKDKEALRIAGWLGAAAATPEILAALARLLRDGDRNVRSAAAEAVGGIGAAAATPEIFTALERVLESGDVDVCSSAEKTVNWLCAAAATPEFLAALLRLLGDEDKVVRFAAAYAVGGIGAAAATPEVLDVVERMLRDRRRDVCTAAGYAVAGIGAAAATPEILAALLRLLGDGDEYVRFTAAYAVGGIGAAATPQVLTELQRILGDGDEYVRSAAADAVGRIGAAAATPPILAALLRLLSDEDNGVRGAAAHAVGGIGAVAATPEILAALLRLLGDGSILVRYTVPKAVGRIGTAAAKPEIFAALERLLGGEDQDVRCAAAETVLELGAAAATPEIRAALAQLLGDEYLHVRRAAAEAVGRICAADATPEILAMLLGLFRDEAWSVRRAAVHAVGGIDAADATPEILVALERILGDESLDVIWAAVEAVGETGAVPLIDGVPNLVIWLGAEHWPHLRIFRRGKRFEAVPLSTLTGEGDPEE